MAHVWVEPASSKYEAAFLAAVAASRELHPPWVSPPATRDAFAEYIRRCQRPNQLSHFVLTPQGQLAGVVNVNEIVRGGFQSGYLGYYAFAPHAGRGFMRLGLTRVIELCFTEHRLHRLEANVQPNNLASVALVRRLGFRKEGLSPRYLHIAGAWRDHERWAMTREDWP